jgi:uncharacterized protein with PhoU and TrkA domain
MLSINWEYSGKSFLHEWYSWDEIMNESPEETPIDAMSPEDILVEMKDTSELMVDLAYSALLYNNSEIAEEISELEERIDKMNRILQRKVTDRTIKTKDVNRALAYIRLGGSLEMIADAAFDIANVVLRDVEPHPILKKSVHDSDAVVTRLSIQDSSILNGRTIGDLKIAENTGMWINAIKRGSQWIYGPESDTMLKAGDVLFASGPPEGEEYLRKASKEAMDSL